MTKKGQDREIEKNVIDLEIEIITGRMKVGVVMLSLIVIVIVAVTEDLTIDRIIIKIVRSILTVVTIERGTIVISRGTMLSAEIVDMTEGQGNDINIKYVNGWSIPLN